MPARLFPLYAAVDASGFDHELPAPGDPRPGEQRIKPLHTGGGELKTANTQSRVAIHTAC